MPPTSKKFGEHIGLVLSVAGLVVGLSVTLAYGQERLKIGSWNLICGISMKISGPIFLAHLSRRLTRWAYSIPMVRPLSVVHTFKLEYLWSQLANQNFMCSITGVGERLHKVLGAGWIKTLVSMATESPHWLIMGKTMSPPFLGCFWSDPF